MINLKDLQTVTKHPLYKTFQGYRPSKIADMLEISPGYAASILNGIHRPSKELNRRISELAHQIRQAEMVQAKEDSK